MPDTLDDDQFLAALKGALSAWQDIPPEFLATARNAYSWLNVDAELAQVAYDSAHDLDAMAGSRSGPALTRVLTFASAQLTIEIESGDDVLLGQIIPAGPGEIEVQSPMGAAVTVMAGDLGCFLVSPVPATPFRLRCRTLAGGDLLTGWVSL